MKTKLLLSSLLSFVFCLLSSQVPQGFNYQAIARDDLGNAIVNQALPVKIAIQTSLTGGTLIYEELFASVTSNQFGLISLVVGTGTQTGGSAASFSAVDWKAQTLFLKTIIQYPGTTWTTMGTSQIWGVPYSLVAKDVAGPLTKLGITGTTDNMDEALFEVKNKAGNTVFAVYNEGIRAYVGNGDAKGVRGGFSVGGYDATKGAPYDLFVLNTDSARFYIDSKPNLKGKRGGFSVGGYDMTKGVSVHDYLDVSKDSVRIYVDSNPATKGKKGGFSVGGYDMTKGGIPAQDYMHVSKDSVRVYVDSNPATKGARGGFSVGGYDMTKGVTGDYFNISGKSEAEVINGEPRVMWYPAKEAFRAGNVLIESKDSVGLNSWASGYQSKAIGQYSQALGYKSIARGRYSTAIGYSSETNGQYSFALGYNSKVKGNVSLAIGQIARASGDYSVAIGYSPSAIGYATMALGYGAAAKKDFAFATGFGTIANGYSSLAMGNRTIASGDYSTSIGKLTTAPSGYETVLGYCNTNYTPISTTGWDLADRLFVIGNGSEETRSDALIVYKNGNAYIQGNVGIGTSTPGYKLQVGNAADGSQARANAWNLLSDASLKTSFTKPDNSLEMIEGLNGYFFYWKTGPDKTRQFGFSAQEVEKVLPEIVSKGEDGLLSLDYGKVTPLLVEAIKEQQHQIVSQQKEIDELKTLINRLIANQTAQVNK